MGQGRIGPLLNNRWLVFVAAMWVQSCAGIGYLFGSISPVLKTSLGYNQRQIASIGVAKDIGDSVGFLAGPLCEILPLWTALLIGALKNFIEYGWVWLIVTGRVPTLPVWAIPKGVQPGQLLVLRGRGLPKQIGLVDHGDQYVRFRVHFPLLVNDRQRELLEEFSKEEAIRESSGNAYAHWWQQIIDVLNISWLRLGVGFLLSILFLLRL